VAILLYREKVREDEAKVEYAFGYPDKDQSLVLRRWAR
jgi:hypothetical protein